MGDLPFRLTSSSSAVWRAFWAEEKIRVVVAGTDDAPHPLHLAALTDLVERWGEVKRAVAGFVGALGADERVPLDPPSMGNFLALDCRFDGAVFAFGPTGAHHGLAHAFHHRTHIGKIKIHMIVA